MGSGANKKDAKGRKDKFYFLAKDQGYRARSAFKLIQLNKKYAFLENAKCVVDLCAAPGGWLQVAQKYMPKPSVIIGLDLEKIRSIPGVITHVEDITSAACRITLKKDLKTMKADVFLHDGAPNTGVSWIQDAFNQNELVLSACKLATEFLVPGGTFVTKVFRSKDYNKLIWVFNQLFNKVEATKPTASRNVSAEIFVVCRDYKAPKKIDPRLLDAKFAFKEMDDGEIVEETDSKKIKANQGAMLNDLFHPEKRKRHREGYAEGDYTLHTINSALDFVQSYDFLGILSRSSELSFKKGDLAKIVPSGKEGDKSSPEKMEEDLAKLENSSLTTEEIKEFLGDLKVLGKKEFKQVIKWRDSMRVLLGIFTKATKASDNDAEKVEEEEEEEDIDVLIAREKETAASKQKKFKKKQRERKQKVLLKLRLGMDAPLDIGVEAQGGLEALPEFDMGEDEEDEDEENTTSKSRKSKKKAVALTAVVESEDEEMEEDEDDDELMMDSDEELITKVQRLDSQMDDLFDEYEKRRVERNPSAKVKKVKEASAAFEEWYGIEADASLEKQQQPGKFDSSDDDSDTSDEDLDDPNNTPEVMEEEEETQLSKKARLFFDNPLFDALAKSQKEKSLFEDELVMHHKKPASTKSRNNNDDDEQKGFEVVPVKEAEPILGDNNSDSEDDGESPIIDSAQAYTLAQRMTTNSGKRDLIDESFNRFAFNDPEGLPTWFTTDENRHNKPTMPETKEAVQIMREKMRALDARPIKKIAEAKFRKQLRQQRRILKAASKSQGLADQEDISERSKLEQAAKVMGKAKKAVRTEKDKVNVVVAKGAHKKIQGRPRGVKGRYKMVDGAMKKESRALKRIAKKNKKSRR